MCDKSDEKEKQIAKITQENKDLRKENNLLNKMIKQMDDDLEIQKIKQCTGTIWQTRNAGGYWYTPTKMVKTALTLFTSYAN